jgi:hypothetical protein
MKCIYLVQSSKTPKIQENPNLAADKHLFRTSKLVKVEYETNPVISPNSSEKTIILHQQISGSKREAKRPKDTLLQNAYTKKQDNSKLYHKTRYLRSSRTKQKNFSCQHKNPRYVRYKTEAAYSTKKKT